MRTLLAAIRDIWCAKTRRCGVGIPRNSDDPLIETLRHHEQAARKGAEESRHRQQRLNEVERQYLRGERHAR